MISSRSWLVEYGRCAYVGVFHAEEAVVAERGTVVVIDTPRGVEWGHILAEATEPFQHLVAVGAGGVLLRLATTTDQAASVQVEVRRQQYLQTTAVHLAAEPVVVLDAELLFDEQNFIVHVLPWNECELDSTLAELSESLAVTVRVLDMNIVRTMGESPAEAKSSCGSCGTGGGCGTGEKSGCSSGSCSRSQVKSADDMGHYFADLRTKMEQEAAHRRPLI